MANNKPVPVPEEPDNRIETEQSANRSLRLPTQLSVDADLLVSIVPGEGKRPMTLHIPAGSTLVMMLAKPPT